MIVFSLDLQTVTESLSVTVFVIKEQGAHFLLHRPPAAAPLNAACLRDLRFTSWRSREKENCGEGQELPPLTRTKVEVPDPDQLMGQDVCTRPSNCQCCVYQ